MVLAHTKNLELALNKNEKNIITNFYTKCTYVKKKKERGKSKFMKILKKLFFFFNKRKFCCYVDLTVSSLFCCLAVVATIILFVDRADEFKDFAMLKSKMIDQHSLHTRTGLGAPINSIIS